MRSILVALVALNLAAAPALAQEDDEEIAAPSAAGVDASKLEGLQKQLSGQHDSDGQLGKLLRIVRALKDGGKDLTADDIGMLQAVLMNMAAKGENPELSAALIQLGPQLEALKRQKQHPDDGGDDDMKGLLDD